MKPCRECGQPFQPRRQEQVLCGILCRQKVAGRARKSVQLPCPTCGKEVKGGRARKYCSVQCRGIDSRSRKRECLQCGTEFTPRDKEHKFCSKPCADQAMVLPPRQCELCAVMFQPKTSASRFCSRRCGSRASGLVKRKGPFLTDRGYIMLYEPEHPMATKHGFLLQHRKVAAEVAGRMLDPAEVVHHINEIKTDNRPENLRIMPKAQHDKIPKPPPKPIQCPHCGGMIGVSGRVRRVVAL